MTDLTRNPGFNQKKAVCVASATLETADFDGTNQLDVFNLPANALVTDAYVITEEAGQTSLTLDVGFDGGAELINDADVDNTGVVKDALTTGVQTDTGKTVSVTPSAEPTQGKFIAIVEFIEYNVATGHLMDVTRL